MINNLYELTSNRVLVHGGLKIDRKKRRERKKETEEAEEEREKEIELSVADQGLQGGKQRCRFYDFSGSTPGRRKTRKRERGRKEQLSSHHCGGGDEGREMEPTIWMRIPFH